MDWWKAELERQGKIVEAQRVTQRTLFDIEMMRTIGYCHGIENYSRHRSGRLLWAKRRRRYSTTFPPTICMLSLGESPPKLIPQIRGMYHGDRSRKQTLVDYGFRMPSALDNRPLTFEEFEHRTNQVSVYVSATPGTLTN